MKKQLFVIVFTLCSCLNAFSQETSLTVDCQNPGWLASYINPDIVPTLRNLTVLGQINSSDLQTIGNLVKNYSLQGRLDLSDVTIVGNILNGDMFGVTDCKLQYLALPLSVGQLVKCVEWVEIDTLVCGSNEHPNFRMGGSFVPSEMDYCSEINNFRIKHLILREGVESFNCSPKNGKNTVLESIQFPNSFKHLKYISFLQALNQMNVPNSVETFGPRLNTNIQNQSDTLYIQSSVKTFWDQWAGYDYRNARLPDNNRNVNGRIKCIYLSENIENFSVDPLHGAQVDIHIRRKVPPTMIGGYFDSNTIVYVPVGYKEVYKATGTMNGGLGYVNWGGATILEEVFAEKIEMNASEVLYVGDSQTLSVEFTPSNTTFKDVTWDVSDNAILSISNAGLCSALNFGETTLSVMSADRSCTDTKTIKVYEHTTAVNLSNSSLKLLPGGRQTLTATTLPAGRSDGKITWTTSNGAVANVDANGNVVGVGKGTCTITATSVDGGHTATCEVTVTQPVEALTLEKHSLSLKVGNSETLFAQISPTSADNKTITWSSSNVQVASVDANGNVAALKAGEAWIKAISNDNAEAKDSCKVTVLQPVTGITLSQESCRLTNIGEFVQLEATVLPDDASNKEVNWRSTNEAVCMVSNGRVVATGYGTAVVMATTVDGGFMASCAIVVEKDVVSVTEVVLSQISATLIKGGTLQLTATALPADATNKTLIWKSSDENVCVTTQTGMLVAMNEGTAVITVVPELGVGQAQCNVTVEAEPSAIHEIIGNNADDSAIYDMQGRRVNQVVKGRLYIVNGKKYIAK